MTDTDLNERKPRRRWNWWKIAFFVLLIVFEITREVAVLSSNSNAQPTAAKLIFGDGEFVSARGRWHRSDGGSPIQPGTVSIECRLTTNQCIEASVTGMGLMFFPPEIDVFGATFTDTGVTYVNDNPRCARYSVTIDTKQQRAIATRIRKPNPTEPNCQRLEERVAMELGNGVDLDREPLKGHFVPLFAFLKGVVDLIYGND